MWLVVAVRGVFCWYAVAGVLLLVELLVLVADVLMILLLRFGGVGY